MARKATEGVLLYAKLGSVKDSYMGELKLVLIESTLTLQLTDLISVVFRDFPVAIETLEFFTNEQSYIPMRNSGHYKNNQSTANFNWL